MPCNGHPGPDCFHEHCRNWYIENGVHGCAKAAASFKASKGTVMNTLTPQIQEVIGLVKSYIGTCERAKQARREWLQSEVNLLKIRIARLAKWNELKRAYQARRQQLTMQHPYGFMADLGYHFSDQHLEDMAKAIQQPTTFDSYADLCAYFDGYHSDSLLANPQKMAALTRAAYE